MRRKALAAGVIAAAIAASWLAVAPAWAGGSTSYVIVHGTSMEPGMHTGDLVVVRQAGSYRTGQVVAYHSPSLGLVLHRIVSVDGDHFVLKGDNNAWLDSYHPSTHDVAGRLVARIPSAGAFAGWAGSPMHGLVIVGPAALGFAFFFLRRSRARTKPKPLSPAGSSSGLEEIRAAQRRRVAGVSFSCIAALAAIVGVLAYRSPSSNAVTLQHPFEHRAEFSYGAAGTAGAAYGDNGLQPGQPVFVKLVPQLSARVGYSFTGMPAAGGTSRMIVTLGDDNGWTRTLSASGTGTFSGTTTERTQTIDLDSLVKLLGQIETTTGVHQDHYRLTIYAEIDVRAGGQTARFTPALRFRLDPFQLRLERQGESDPLVVTKPGSYPVASSTPATVRVLVFAVPVRAARAAAPAVALIAAGIALAIGRRSRRDRLPRSGRLVPVVELPPMRSVDVSTLDALSHLAGTDEPIMLAPENDFGVVRGDLLFRYRASGDG